MGWFSRKKEHQWDYMGQAKDNQGELGYCDLCKKYRLSRPDGTDVIISKSKYEESVIPGSWNW